MLDARPIEIGSLSTVSPTESHFIGSSSGVFFVNTVHRAFALSADKSSGGEEPQRSMPIDNCIVGPSSDADALPSDRQHDGRAMSLGSLPDKDLARQLIMIYFRLWHPLFSFIHGPSFLQEVENLYDVQFSAQLPNRREICLGIIFHCILNIAALDRPDLGLPSSSRISSASALLSCLGGLVSKHDVPCIQALMAGQIYLAATMSLQAASTVGGMLQKQIYHAGFHRCPARYIQLSSDDCAIRKRIFWSAYAMDRYLSLALGHPLGFQDSDIDTCVPGLEELHRPAPRIDGSASTPVASVVVSHLPRDHPSAITMADDHNMQDRSLASDVLSATSQTADPRRVHGEDALANYIAYGRLTGRVLEIFHKSIAARSAEYSKILNLTSDVHAWWNALPQHLQDLPRSSQNVQERQTPSLGLFFTVIYHQLILLINRPFLSLDSSSPEFRSSLQICIAASRSILSTLKEQMEGQTCVSWPGILSGTWMSGLILAFACALNLYPSAKGVPEIESCLSLLDSMSQKWATARHCHSALRVLLDDLQSASGKGSNRSMQLGIRKRSLSGNTNVSQDAASSFPQDRRSSKRQRKVPTDSPTTQEQQDSSSNASCPQIQADNNQWNPDLQADANFAPFDTSWMQSDMFGADEPYMPDIFGHLSWEALFQDDGMQSHWPDGT